MQLPLIIFHSKTFGYFNTAAQVTCDLKFNETFHSMKKIFFKESRHFLKNLSTDAVDKFVDNLVHKLKLREKKGAFLQNEQKTNYLQAIILSNKINNL